MAFVACFLGKRLAYTYEVFDGVPDKRMVMRTTEGPFPMETTYTRESGNEVYAYCLPWAFRDVVRLKH